MSEFDLRGMSLIPPGQNAILSVYLENYWHTPGTIFAYSYPGNGTIERANLIRVNTPNAVYNPFSSTMVGELGAFTYSVDATGPVNDAITKGLDFIGFCLQTHTPDTVFDSGYYGGAEWPQLAIVPEPGALVFWFWVAALVAWKGRAKIFVTESCRLC